MDNNSHSQFALFNLVTFNCLGTPLLPNTPARLRTIARELNDPALDVICLQEVQFSAYVPLLHQNLPQFPFAAFEPFVYAPKGGLITFSRRPITRKQFFLYPERGWWHTPSLADHMLHKGILMTELTYADQPVVILNTHLTANYNANWSRANRYALLEQAQLRRLAAVVNDISSDSIVIICGDFNIPRQSWLYSEFVELTGVFDPLAKDTKPTQYLSPWLPSQYHMAIDHVFVRLPAQMDLAIAARLRFENKIRLTTGRMARLSDHMAIQLGIEWPERDGKEPAGVGKF